MNWWLPHTFEAKRPYLEGRTCLITAIRGFFDQNGFTEVQTPVLQIMPSADLHVHGLKVENGPKDREYLHTSPEFAMKKLLVAGMPKIYQLCPVFRKDPESRLHNPEFTMLEWYRAESGYTAIMEDCEALLRHCAAETGVQTLKYGDKSADIAVKWQKLTVCEAFETYAGLNLEELLDSTPGFAAAAGNIGVRTHEDDSWEDIFHAIMAEKIEPHLGSGAPCILYEYPASMASLSRKQPDDPRFAERFELYVCGVELANAFSELTDSAEQRARFEAEMAQMQAVYGHRYPIDEDFLAALELGMPESGGIALGVDRLAMLFTGAEAIDQVLWTGRS